MRPVRLIGIAALFLVFLPMHAGALSPMIPGCASVTFPAYAISVAPFSDSPEHRYFPETKHSLNYGFKQFWEVHGGLIIFGYPVEEEHVTVLANDTMPRTVQGFERGRFEYHPENPEPFTVELGLLGSEAVVGRMGEAPFQRPPAPALDPPFRAFWQANGGLLIFGYPISHPFVEQGEGVGHEYTTQYFERAVMEVHPEVNGGAILLRRIGAGSGILCYDDARGMARIIYPWDR